MISNCYIKKESDSSTNLNKKKFNKSNSSIYFMDTSNDEVSSELLKFIDNNNASKVKRLLQNGANPNLSLDTTKTPLARAIDNKNYTIVKHLLEHGANPNSLEYFNPSPQQTDDTLKSILDLSDDEFLKQKAQYLKDGIDINNSNLWNQPVLNLSIENNYEKITKLLLKYKSCPNHNPSNIFCDEPLFIAVNNNFTTISIMLLNKKANPNAPGDNKLLAAIENSNYEIVRYLLKNGASTYYCDENNKNILIASIDANDKSIFKEVCSYAGQEMGDLEEELLIKESAIQHIENEIQKLHAHPKQKHVMSKQLKIIRNEFFELNDKKERFTDMVNMAIVYADQKKSSLFDIRRLINVRGDENNDENLETNTWVKNKIQELKDAGYVNKLFKSPIEKLINDTRHTLINSVQINPNKKYSVVDILKKNTFCENKSQDSKLVSDIYKTLDQYNDPIISTVLTCVALGTLGKYYGQNSIKIFAAKNDSGSVSNLVDEEEYLYNITSGLSRGEKNQILFSSLNRKSKATRTLLHEMTHTVRAMNNDVSTVEECLQSHNFLSDTIKELHSILKSAKGLKKNVVDYVNSNITRIKDLEDDVYFTDSYANEDVLCDFIGCIQYKYRHPDRKSDIEKIMKPLSNFIENDFLPKALKFIVNSSNLNQIKLPQVVENLLIERYPNKLNSLNIPITVKPRNIEPIVI